MELYCLFHRDDDLLPNASFFFNVHCKKMKKKKNTYIHKYSQEKYAKRPVAMYVVFVCCSLQLFIISKGLMLSC